MTEPVLETLQLDDIRMRVATQGSGPLVLFCHGWPESWYSAASDGRSGRGRFSSRGAGHARHCCDRTSVAPSSA